MNRDLPKLFDEFVDARKNGFLAAKEFKENGGKLAGTLCSYTPKEILDAGNIVPFSQDLPKSGCRPADGG